MVVLRAYMWLSTQGSVLMLLRGWYIVLGMEPGSAVCKTSTVSAVLSLWAQEFAHVFYWSTHLSLPNPVQILTN